MSERFEIGVRDAGWSGLRLAALCIGVGAYSGSSRLNNPVRDAEALFEAINKCPDCRAAIVRDPPTKSVMTDHLQNKFLNELAALSVDKLPEVVALVLAGHGMQHESNVFLIPVKAKCDSKMDLEDNCLSHTRVLEYLHECLDAHARRASGSAQKEVKFVLIMDMCRVPGEFALTKTISEPDQNKAPGCWSICYSTSRGSVAADGAPGSHSPLVLGLLDPQSGIFAPGVLLKEGIEHACSVVEEQSGVDTRQSPTDMKLRLLGNFTLQPNRAEGKKRLDNPQEGAVAGAKKQRCEGCAASSDSTQQAFPCDVFISHAWDKDDEGRHNHERVKRLNAGLKRFGMKTWFDDDQRQGNNYKGTAEGIRGSAVVLICVTRRYMEKVKEEAGNNCKREFEFAADHRTDLFMLPVVMEECMTGASEWDGSLGLVLGRHLSHNLTSDLDDEFDKAVSEIAAAVRTKIGERLLPDLQKATSRIVQDAVSSREASPTPSDQSDMSTAPQTPNQEVALVYIERLVTAFKVDMTNFIEGFLKNPNEESAPRKWKLCELLLVRFMRDKVAPSCDVEMAENLGLWQVKCQDSESDVIAVFNEMMLDLKNGLKDPKKLIETFDELGYEFAETNKQNHTSIFVIDWMVQHRDSPWALPLLFRKEWKKKVVLQWFVVDHNNTETSDDFLERAEKFLQEGVKGDKWGIKILGKVIETNSYVAFFRMEALAALLLREYCSQQEILHAHQQKQHDAQENDDQKLAINLIVSSSNWHLSFSKGEGPSGACVSEMVWHLQRIACLPAKTLETNEYNFSQLESVKCEPLYNLQKMPASMPLVASGGARVGPINAEREKGAIPPMRPLGQKRLDSEAVGSAAEGAVAALKEREFVTMHSALTTCHQSEREARDLLDKAVGTLHPAKREPVSGTSRMMKMKMRWDESSDDDEQDLRRDESSDDDEQDQHSGSGCDDEDKFAEEAVYERRLQVAKEYLAATDSPEDRWRAAPLRCLQEFSSLDLSECEITSENLPILLDCMPQLTSLDLRKSPRVQEELDWDAGLLKAIRKQTSLQVLRVGLVSSSRAAHQWYQTGTPSRYHYCPRSDNWYYKACSGLACRSLGLKWKEVGSGNPSTGTEIKNEPLAAALQKQVKFKKKEWQNFQVTDLSSNDYIRAGNRYFKPAGTCTLCHNVALLADALKSLTRLTELRLTVGSALDAFDNGGQELFGAIGGMPALRILHMDVQGNIPVVFGPASCGCQSHSVTGKSYCTAGPGIRCLNRARAIKEHSPAVARTLADILSGLKELTDLNLQHHVFCTEGTKSLANALQSLSGITKLRMGALGELPAELRTLTGLQILGLSGCKSLENLPAVLRALPRVQEMDLSYCMLSVLPTEIGALHELQKIDLSNCTFLCKLPAEIGSLTALRQMDLSYCELLNELPAELGTLTALREINLSFCTILKELPAALGALTALREINLSFCTRLKELPAELGTLKELRKINLSGCKLKEIPAQLGALKELQEIDLSCSSLEKLPAWIGGLTALREINLSTCRSLEKLPAELGALTALRVIDLTKCKSLKELPAELGALTQLHKIVLSSCYALHTPPPHVVVQGTVAVLEFLHDLAKGNAPCHLIKLVLLGNKCAGKSSLADSLVQGCPVTRDDSDRTVGIEVRRWSVGRESQLVVNIYDAAGQRVYRATHGLFMSAGALFLHVVRSDMPEDEAIETLLEWVEVVQQEAPGAVMGVVWTHLDCASVTVSKSRVLGRVHEEITEQMQVVDDAMREMEDVIADKFHDRGAEQGLDLCEKWMRAREKRDAVLKALDQRALVCCTAEDEVVGGAGGGGDRERATISEIAEVFASVVAQHHKMQVLEDKLSMSESVGDGEALGVELKRLRHKRLHRPRMLFSYSVSSLTGDGLDELRDAFTAVMENQRLFPHVGQRVPLNYSMLERLAQEGNKFRDNCVNVKTSDGNKFLEFAWAEFGTFSPIAHVTAVLCDPERADQELINAEQLNKKVAVAKWGGRTTSLKQARLAQQAGAVALIIINRDNTLMTLDGDDSDSAVTIPVILVTADAGATLLQEGSHVTLEGSHATLVGHVTDRAAWETVVTKHVKERSSDGLRDVCKKPYVRLGELEEEASKVGMDKDEVLRALKFLHAAGSVLHYGSDTHRSSPGLQNTVLMQPQFIIDAISYVIREPSADNVNDKVRKNDECIRKSADGEALDRYLGYKEGHGAGELSKQLLRHLWRDVDPQDHRVLVQLMMAFKLLRPLQSVDEEKYLVPAMLVTDKLPLEYVEPKWWCPSFASDVAEMSVDDASKRAEMLIIYQVLGGRLPFGFMSELQVSLAQAEAVQEGRHYAPETAVVDRLCGSVLSAAYKCGGGRVREWVIVSRDQTVQEQANTEAPVPASDCIRIMGWVGLDSDKGSTDWRLFRRVTRQIEDMRQRASGLCLKKMVFYVDGEGRQSKYLHVTAALASRELLRLEFDGGVKQDIDRDLVLPGASEIKLMKAKQHRLKETAGRHIDAFFAKKVDDSGIDVHAEGQAMMRICLNAESTWTCNVHPQPTLADLHSSIAQSRQRNVRVLHLSGLGREECGFIWNANDAVTAHKTVDIEEISRAIGKVAGEKGPVECVVLNACSTETMGRLLRKQGVPNVLCWNTPVQDETARELVDEFYPALVEDKSGSRGYKEAFLAAVKKMGGVDAVGADRTVSGESHRPSTTTRNASPDASSTKLERESAEDQGYGKSSQDGPVRPCQLDIVLFLSEDGGIGPFSLWRERPAAEQVAAAEGAVDPEIKNLFVDKGLGTVCADVCRELNVKCADDLEARVRGMKKQNLVFDVQFLNNEFPKYIKEKLTLGQKLDLVSIIRGERDGDGNLGGQRLVASEAKRPHSPEEQEDLQMRKKDRHDFDHPPSGGCGQLKRRREEDMIGQSSSTNSEAVVQGGARQRRSALDEILALFREKGLDEVLCESVCRKLGASTVEDLRLAQDSDIDGLKGTLDLEPITIRKLKLLVKEVSAAALPVSTFQRRLHAGTIGAVEERADFKSLQTLFKSDKARVSVDFHSFERSQAIHLLVEEILDGEVLREAEDFADLISPVFRVILQGASGGKVPDGQTVDLIVELEDVEDNLNTDSLVFIKKSEEPDGMWCGVSGGTFDLVPSERGKGLVLRGRVVTDSFSWYGVACCHVKVAAHHVQKGQNRRLKLIIYSGEPKGSYPIPRYLMDLTSFQGTYAPKLRGFFMFERSQGPIVLKHGAEFTIQVEAKGEGSDIVVKEGTLEWIHESSHVVWTICDMDVQDIHPKSKLTVKISRKSTALETVSSGSFCREYTLQPKDLPPEVETEVTSLGYWPDLTQYQGPRKGITCGYCLSSNDAQESEEINVVGVGGKLLLGGCCKRIKSGLMGIPPTAMTDRSVSVPPDTSAVRHGGSASVDSMQTKGSVNPKFGDGPRVALCIGIDDYPGKSKLPNCVADAEDMGALCEQKLGFAHSAVKVLKNADKKSIMKAVREMRDEHAKDGSLIWFFYSGHAVEHNGVSYLLPLGMESNNEEDYGNEAVSVDEIMRLFSVFTSAVNVILLDCCRENDLNNTFTKSKGTSLGTNKGFGKGLRSRFRNAEFVVGLACDAGTCAYPNDDARNSFYTEALLRHLPVPDREIEKSLKEVSIDVFKKTQKKQRPWKNDCLHEELVLVTGN